MAAAEYDVFLSHAWADGARPLEIKAALEGAGLRVWFDAEEIEDFAGITAIVTKGLAKSKALVAYQVTDQALLRAGQFRAPPYKFLLDGIADQRARGSEAALLGGLANRVHRFLR
jgi:hypothetical protein